MKDEASIGIYSEPSTGLLYVGDSCTGCKHFYKYIHFIKRIKVNGNNLCRSCESVVPAHIPVEQHTRYLDRIFRKQLDEQEEFDYDM